MENYSKVRSVEHPSVCPFSVPADTPEVRVKDGSKIRNLLRFALGRMEAKPKVDEEGEEVSEADRGPPGPPARPLCRQLVFTASGKGVSKAITCAELVKKRIRGLHQQTSLASNTLTDVWEPLEPAAGLDGLTVSRKLPVIWILLSKDPLDQSLPGYQAPGRCDNLWPGEEKEEAGPYKRKRGTGRGGGGRGRGGGRHAGRPRDIYAPC
ncbi:ribonuclease P protein subunit p25-like protein [Corythoichthys intestinalis]|uniref:ribonuclease P protein subunit p25-like protein n=1 Tax=Corythoichthys intestinalis TaxID=161448 RepID=UPI0025A5B104|nr:ribonuclease P protein subunit p25-like protein [Corythoichthys intestinalis]XP_057689264.1 ribonuclease P protein subunit p25-like protein [Corythoichthys intestinalis]XP_057689265.1 ribonuclease P protein subunit p25-like protein [Corythoichthys intestinalis]XP_057689295.1 ribonuclease P protein subunit p25-like protein [Corythoichthys intestinalis]XP_057689296.1 ribonuclease P protein subunit p25-like protein [Corythoichthys intestinalis]XP_057689297.1 ribonuclease P protein subunit p25-